jgi:catechol 2,3-dioxygenase-like lactoylglutathione lyase family enzyme
VELAKRHIDVGLSTNALEEMLGFWQKEIGLGYEGVLKLGGGHHQHRHDMNGSVLKVNHARDPLEPAPPCGYRELLIAREGLKAERSLRDPDGNAVTLVPRGQRGIQGIGVTLAVRDAGAFHAFYGEALGLESCGDNAYRCGDSLLQFAQDPAAVPAKGMFAPGYRYTTIQVRDCDAEHAGILARGGQEGRPPVTLGEVARISFVRDPDGNWIEISQRASLTGALPAD